MTACWCLQELLHFAGYKRVKALTYLTGVYKETPTTKSLPEPNYLLAMPRLECLDMLREDFLMSGNELSSESLSTGHIIS